ncbi:hypothetical protein OUZ56_001665 [Daphnia magna]|uniref:Uncharacterized protein n=1 Tax=Daphnia magna TaxID=35525 RepID=A0ABR0A3C2_9CRUS|nr:hypothetical protein OUZ56_001665 [Daphnia magna]
MLSSSDCQNYTTNDSTIRAPLRDVDQCAPDTSCAGCGTMVDDQRRNPLMDDMKRDHEIKKPRPHIEQQCATSESWLVGMTIIKDVV